MAGNYIRGRDSAGFYLEEFVVDDVIEHWPGRTISEWENQQFTLLTGNPSSTHLDRQDAAAVGHSDMLVNGGYLLALVHGLSARDVSANNRKAVYFVGMNDVRILKPSYPGDTITAFTKVLATRESKSKPDQGLVTVETWGQNQRGERVIEFKRVIMVWKRGRGFPEGSPDFSPKGGEGE